MFHSKPDWATVAFHRLISLSRVTLTKIMKTIAGVMPANKILIGKGKLTSKMKVRKNSRSKNIGTIIAQKIP